ncbi:D-hexose-6-phosphate mutarotase [Ferrimonas marina]|uniref:Putative glucose-6-phosphate 1-epimerase n=1 Tax=Ferrimonas marina TaxID=299255 RepID=A0A1M5YW19_9GAMM|nr:D-hexose-6-phosphate mutarotase [Ferrimonas marina]SHI16199.1 glucose-6-phosphate 1-epimerase [Ferrimonas marina]
MSSNPTYPSAWHCHTLQCGPDSLRLCEFGGQVLSWCSAGKERLWLSPLADDSGSKAIRGGVPLCFPWFGGRPGLPSHGFARTRRWQLLRLEQGEQQAQAKLAFSEDDHTLALWPYRFQLTLTVTLRPGELDLALTLHNTGTESWDFTAALHTYLGMAPDTPLPELVGRHYFDKLSDGQDKEFLQPIAPNPIDAIVPGLGRIDAAGLSLHNHGSDATVVWNPGPSGAKALADVPDAAFAEFLCLESAVALQPVTLAAGAQYQLGQRLRLG